MDILHTAEIAVTLFLQNLGGWLTGPMKLVSFLGQEEFYLLLMPILYWCVNASLGLRIGVMLLLAQSTNSIIKTLLHGPRPYWFDPRVLALSTEASFGAPSGHAQSAAGIWGLLATSIKRRSITIICIVIIFLVGLSRIYLGVHFLSDVLFGWLLGAILLVAFLKWETVLTRWLKKLRLPQQIALAAGSSVGIILISILAVAIFPNWVIPSDWMKNASAAAPGITIDPLNLDGIFTIGGTWFGLLAGFAWLWHRHGLMDTKGTPGQLLLRYLIGVAGVFILWYGLGAILPRTPDLIGFTLRYLRYTLVGCWISFMAPLLFARLNLCKFSKSH